MEIKQAVSKLPPRKKLALARWMQAQVDDRLKDEEMMAIAAEGARALDVEQTRGFDSSRAHHTEELDRVLAGDLEDGLRVVGGTRQVQRQPGSGEIRRRQQLTAVRGGPG